MLPEDIVAMVSPGDEGAGDADVASLAISRTVVAPYSAD